MAGGWSRDGAVQDQIDASVDEAVTRARQQLHKGDSLEICEGCGESIPEARRRAIKGVHLCVTCQELSDQKAGEQGSVNRRGSKDSQLR